MVSGESAVTILRIPSTRVSRDGASSMVSYEPTSYHQRQRQRARMQLYDSDLPGAERSETRDRLKRNQFGQGVSHTGEPASRTELEQLPKEHNTANKILLDLVRLGVMQGGGVSTDEETVTVFDGAESGVFRRKQTRRCEPIVSAPRHSTPTTGEGRMSPLRRSKPHHRFLTA